AVACGAMSDLLTLAYETLERWLALGHESIERRGVRFVRERRMPQVYDANFATRVRAGAEDEIEAMLAAAEEIFADFGHRHFLWDPGMPLPFEARLQLDGYAPRDEVVLVLEGALRARGPALDLRPVASDADWDALTELCWLDHQEEVELGFHDAWPRAFSEELCATKRLKGPAVRYFLARAHGVDCAFFSSFPGENGVGKVEDLFTRADFRGRGIGTALIAACVDDARTRGAGPVLIGARLNDTPKQMYAALGFRALCYQRSYLRTDVRSQP
ncbi:MAG: GNAT family N-acetyltransferase, partial [Solirubrobacteraceae bacterium]